jgi:hypothetical protein
MNTKNFKIKLKESYKNTIYIVDLIWKAKSLSKTNNRLIKSFVCNLKLPSSPFCFRNLLKIKKKSMQQEEMTRCLGPLKKK